MKLCDLFKAIDSTFETILDILEDGLLVANYKLL